MVHAVKLIFVQKDEHFKCQWEENFCFCLWKGKMDETKQHTRDSYSSSSPDSLSLSLNLNIYLSTPQTRVCVCMCVLIMVAQMEKHLSLWNKRFPTQPLFPFQATLTPSLCVWRENIFSFFPSLTLTLSHMLGGECVPNYIQTFLHQGWKLSSSCSSQLSNLTRVSRQME